MDGGQYESLYVFIELPLWDSKVLFSILLVRKYTEFKKIRSILEFSGYWTWSWGESESVNWSVVNDSLPGRGLQPARLLCLWDSPGKKTGAVVILFYRVSSQTRDRTWVSCIAGRFFTIWATRELGAALLKYIASFFFFTFLQLLDGKMI